MKKSRNNSKAEEASYSPTPNKKTKLDLSSIKSEDLVSNRNVQMTAASMLTKCRAQTTFSGMEHAGTSAKNYASATGPKEAAIDQGFSVSENCNQQDVFEQAVLELGRRYQVNKRSKICKETEKPNVEDLLSDEDFELDNIWDDKPDLPEYLYENYNEKTKLWETHCSKFGNLTVNEVRQNCLEILPDLRETMNGNILRKRHQMYLDNGSVPHDLVVSIPCLEDNQIISNTIYDVLLKLEVDSPAKVKQNFMKYAAGVLFSEAVIRIYGKINCLSLVDAEKELLFHGGYDGELITSCTTLDSLN